MKPWKVPFLGYRSPACLPSPVSAVDEFQEAEFMSQALINEDGEEPVPRELTGTRDPVPKVAVALLGACLNLQAIQGVGGVSACCQVGF